jgi:hypothetical protein
VTPHEGELGRDAIVEVAAVVHACEAIAHRGLVEIARHLQGVGVLDREAQDHVADRDVLAVLELARVADARPLHRGAVAAAEVGDPQRLVLALEAGVDARQARIGDAQIHLGGAAQRGSRLVDGEDLPDPGALHHLQRETVALGSHLRGEDDLLRQLFFVAQSARQRRPLCAVRDPAVP